MFTERTDVISISDGGYSIRIGYLCASVKCYGQNDLYKMTVKKGKIAVTGRGGPQGCETSRLPHVLDNWLTDDSKVVSPTCRPNFTPRKITRTHLC
jgi:hypothetical protein